MNNLQEFAKACENAKNTRKNKEKQMKQTQLFMKEVQKELKRPQTICLNCSKNDDYTPCHKVCGLGTFHIYD